jgi:hypothetical protein
MSKPYDGDATLGDLVNIDVVLGSHEVVPYEPEDGDMQIPRTSRRFIVRKTTTMEIEFPDGNL